MSDFFDVKTDSNRLKFSLSAAFVVATACASQAMIRKPSLEEAPASYFRVTADYTVIETGEEISFDYVVGCGGIISHYSYTTPSVIYEAHPTMQYIATQDGAAIGVESPGLLCDQSLFEFVPDDFRPFMMWFPDVQDLSFAWGYATEIAYESPKAHVRFKGASVEPATEAEWRDSRTALADAYEQVGALPGPWGYSFSRGPDEERLQVALKGKKRGLAEICNGYSRLQLPPFLVDELFESAPDGTGRYWILDGAAYAPIKDRLRKPDVEFFGQKYDDFLRRGEGTVQQNPGGTISTNFKYDALTDVYPVLPTRQAMEQVGYNLDAPQEEYFQTLLLGNAWNGFSACFSGSDPTVLLNRTNWILETESASNERITVEDYRAFDTDKANKDFWLHINQERIGANPQRNPGIPWILDREGFVYFHNGWGHHQLS